MIECKISKADDIVEVSASGKAHDILLELLAEITIIHSEIRKKSPDSAKIFKEQLILNLLAPGNKVWEIKA